MIFKVSTIINYISNFFTLETGDLILTGTPSGVGSVKAGDKIEIGLSNSEEVLKAVFHVEQTV